MSESAYPGFNPITNASELLKSSPLLPADTLMLLTLRFQINEAWDEATGFRDGYRTEPERQRLYELIGHVAFLAYCATAELWGGPQVSATPRLHGAGRSQRADVIPAGAAAFVVAELLNRGPRRFDDALCRLLLDLTFTTLGDVTFDEVEALARGCDPRTCEQVLSDLRWLRAQGEDECSPTPEPVRADEPQFDFGFDTE